MEVTKDDLSDILFDSLKFKREETLSTDVFENVVEYSISFKSPTAHCENSERLFENMKSHIKKVIKEYKDK